MRVIVIASAGKMGRTNIQVVDADPDSQLVGATEAPGSPFVGKDAGEVAGLEKSGVAIVDSIEKITASADVIIDFSSPKALHAHLKYAVEHKTALVVGTTGLSDSDIASFSEAAKSIPVIWAPNFSVGINLLNKLTELAASVLNEGFDVEIIESHHRMKKDAPSGTALLLLNTLKKAYATEDAVYGREGITGARPSGQIGVHAIRGGDIVGDHTVLFAGIGERIELTHKASTREILAKGAFRAAKFILKKGPGLWTMNDVLNF